MQVLFMADNTNNQVTLRGTGNGSQPFERPFGLGPFGGMTKMANGQTQCFDFPDIGTSLLNAITAKADQARL